MSTRFFLDTNILVYCFDNVSPSKNRRARQLVKLAVTTRKGVISYQVVQEFFNVALKRFAQPLTLAEADQYLDVVLRPLLAIHSSPALYSEALHLTARHHLHWYDALIVAGAIEADCGVLYSEDLQHGQRFGDLRIENPFA